MNIFVSREYFLNAYDYILDYYFLNYISDYSPCPSTNKQYV